MFSENYFSINFIGDDSKVDTPVPIPNTEVKHFYGEDSLRENSKLPIIFFLHFFTRKHLVIPYKKIYNGFGDKYGF